MSFKVHLLLFSILFFTVSSSILEASNKKESLHTLNTIRMSAGLIPFKTNTFLDKSATSHAKYIIRNQISGHRERKGKYNYTGRTPDMRVRNAGYGSSFTMENVSINAKNGIVSIDTLFSAIYHRFVFLNLERDEIGFGDYHTTKKRRILDAYVYNFGSTEVVEMCKRKYKLKPKSYYTSHVCKKDATVVPWTVLESRKNKIRSKNAAIVLFPYAGQRDVSPAFYNESPDPLPGYKVSGFPISVQFNEAVYKKIKLKTFRLYDAKGKEIKKTKILDKKRDRNHLFTAYEYALMPLERLDYNSRYSVIFSALVDGVKIERKWSFTTKSFHEKLYTLTQKETRLHGKKGETLIVYSKPKNKKDILRYYKTKGGLKVSFIDQNTLKVTLPKHRSSKKATLTLSNKRRVVFIMESP